MLVQELLDWCNEHTARVNLKLRPGGMYIIRIKEAEFKPMWEMEGISMAEGLEAEIKNLQIRFLREREKRHAVAARRYNRS